MQARSVKILLLTALLAGASLAARAQTYYLDLTNQLLDVPLRAVVVAQVLDGRPGAPPLGIAYRGVGGKSAAIAFRQGLGSELTAFAQSQLPARPTDHAVVLCVRRLHLSETLGGTKEQAAADLTADVYERLPDGYHFVQPVAAQANTLGREVTYYHAAHLVQMLSQCLSQLTQADWSAAARRPARTLSQLPADVPAASGLRAAVLREVPRRGIYLRFDQFLANRPDTSVAFHLDTLKRHYRSPLARTLWLGVPRVRPQAARGTDPSAAFASMWGFCDGQRMYARYDKEFYPLMRQRNYFTFVGEAPVDQFHAAAKAEAQGRAALMAGIVGVGVARTNVPDHSGEPMAYSIDMSTGASNLYPGLKNSLHSDTAFVYIYRPAPAVGSNVVTVSVNGQEQGTLCAGQYLEVAWAKFGKPLRLCLSGVVGALSCQYLVPNTGQINYLRINAPTATYPWQWMPAAQGSADLDELDKRSK